MTYRRHLSMFAMAAASIGVLFVVLACGAEQPLATDPSAVPAAPAPAPAATPASTGCAKDNDCKGERVCEKGECVAPR